MNYRIFPLGDRALTIDFGNEISALLNERVLKLAQFFGQNLFAGLTEVVPAYGSLTVFYETVEVRKNFPEFPTAFAAVKNQLEIALQNSAEHKEIKSRLVKIPVCFDEDFALDLAFVAAENNLSTENVVEIFLAETYRVFMLGFLPGFSYMGEIDERIAAGRRQNPRLKVAAGSVGIAGRQTGIYSLESPGGWQIVGRTPARLFTPDDENPTLLRPGDSIKFYAIDKKAFTEIERRKLPAEK